MPSATLTYTLTTLAVVFTQAVGGSGLETLELPAWLVAITAAAALGARFVLYVRQIAADSAGAQESGDAAANDREMLVLMRQLHEILQKHVEEIRLLREGQNSLRGLLSEHDAESRPAIKKIHEIHAEYFGENNPRKGVEL